MRGRRTGESAVHADPREVSREALALIDEMEDLLGERVLAHATRLT
ncbi:hypothetical protein [Streptomyces thermolilacinus]